MDSLTQALLGAGVQGAILGRFQGRRALVYGALLGTLPDLDVVIGYADPVTAMTSHRGFSHALLVLTGLACALTWAVRKRHPGADYGPGRLFLAVWLALITHTLLDAFTSYGTQLFWPLTPIPTAWASIFIIDPVFTVPLLVAVWLSARRLGARHLSAQRMTDRAITGLNIALAWCVLYLGWTLIAQHWMQARVRDALIAQGITAEAVFATPMPFNTLLWRVVVKSGDQYVEAVSGVFDRRAPETVVLPLGTELLPALAASPQYARLAWFSGGWLRADAIGETLVLTDLRMGVAGFYTFRFAMAQYSEAGWQTITPERWPSPSGSLAQWRQMIRRIVVPAQPLPLADWAATTGLR